MAERDGRPSPEALLAAAKQEDRGRLKIFLGAAPGVGKTYEMLLAAQPKRREGADIVVGIVETHGRRETEELVEGLEVIPRRQVDYKGHLLTEMVLDAILKRRPQLVFVDEHELRPALQDRVQIHLGQKMTLVIDLPPRDDLEPFDQLLGLAPSVSFDDPDDDVGTFPPLWLGGEQHLVGLANPRGGTEENLEPAAVFLFCRSEQCF